MDTDIKKIYAREILDSRGNPTIEVEVFCKNAIGRASVPSGASTGSYEALELRDKGKGYSGKRVQQAVKIVNEIISKKLIGYDVTAQREIDLTLIDLDGTENKSKLGANSILGVSLACLKCAANLLGMPVFRYLGGVNAHLLPIPMMNLINGGKHAGNKLDFQEFMIMPVGAKTLSDAVFMGAEIYHELKKLLLKKCGASAVNVGDEGGFAPPIENVKLPLEFLASAIENLGLILGKEVVMALDCAANDFYDSKAEKYCVNGKKYDNTELIDFYTELTKEFPIKSIEDPLNENDFAGFAELTKKIGQKVQIVGDDLFVTNIHRLKKGVLQGAGNALLFKINQIGTITEALDTAQLAISNGYNVIVSHRSGETEDTTIADISVGLNAGLIKCGAPCRTDRNSKYNQLLRIADYLGISARFARFKYCS
jgi:enolase